MNLFQDKKDKIYEEGSKEKKIISNDAFVNRAWVGSTIAAVVSLFLF